MVYRLLVLLVATLYDGRTGMTILYWELSRSFLDAREV